ncbi:hypothetical protein BV25DRAFT_1690854 [Artomyces pyxidatus]|uniref:Uncharacterized protein n=1 Tax=Artomyces pyxidatus TaxID=48021 RepID=A0ACB8TA74_9AGAM|nr:hypothetical protein BV25DRAFT_1690854 [Artomyces pyxidatus]
MEYTERVQDAREGQEDMAGIRDGRCGVGDSIKKGRPESISKLHISNQNTALRRRRLWGSAPLSLGACLGWGTRLPRVFASWLHHWLGIFRRSAPRTLGRRLGTLLLRSLDLRGGEMMGVDTSEQDETHLAGPAPFPLLPRRCRTSGRGGGRVLLVFAARGATTPPFRGRGGCGCGCCGACINQTIRGQPYGRIRRVLSIGELGTEWKARTGIRIGGALGSLVELVHDFVGAVETVVRWRGRHDGEERGRGEGGNVDVEWRGQVPRF